MFFNRPDEVEERVVAGVGGGQEQGGGHHGGGGAAMNNGNGGALVNNNNNQRGRDILEQVRIYPTLFHLLNLFALLLDQYSALTAHPLLHPCSCSFLFYFSQPNSLSKGCYCCSWIRCWTTWNSRRRKTSCWSSPKSRSLLGSSHSD